MSTRMIEALAALQAGEVRREASECRCQARMAPQLPARCRPQPAGYPAVLLG